MNTSLFASMLKPVFILALVLAPTLSLAAEITLTEAQRANVKIATTTVSTRVSQAQLALTGALSADRRKRHRVTPVVSGIVDALRVVENETVRKGQVLARLRSHDLGQAQADYLEALARYDLARAERARIEGLWKDGIVAESRWLKVDSEYKGARATLDARRRLLSLTGLSDQQITALARRPDQLAEFVLTSPIDGMVTRVEIESGQLLSAGQTAFHVADLSRLWAEVRIPVASLSQIKVGTQAQIQVAAAMPGRRYQGRLQSLGGEVEAQSQTLSGRIVVDNTDGQLRPGMYTRVTLGAVPVRGLMVPASAVFRVGDQAYVFQAMSARRFVPVKVDIGQAAKGWIPVRSGIAEGVRIVSGGVAELKSHWQYQGGE